MIQKQPAAIQLRYLQTLVEIGAEKNTTIVFPLPIDILRPRLGGGRWIRPRPARGRTDLIHDVNHRAKKSSFWATNN